VVVEDTVREGVDAGEGEAEDVAVEDTEKLRIQLEHDHEEVVKSPSVIWILK